MANDAPKVIPTESLINPPETASSGTTQPTQSVTIPSARRAKAPGKRGRPRKTTAIMPVTTASLTRTTRRIAQPKTVVPRVTLLNRLVNISVVAAVFIVALAIQRIVPTESVMAPKVESLPAQAVAPVPPAPATAETPAQETSPAPTPAPAPTAAPQQPPKVVAKVKNPKPAKTADHHTTLNAGGTEDLDSEAARQAYLAKTKTATRTAAPTK